MYYYKQILDGYEAYSAHEKPVDGLIEMTEDEYRSALAAIGADEE